MQYPNKTIVKSLRKKYPKGTRVRLLKMNDPQSPPIGTKGTVMGVDDIGSLLISWDTGARLNLLYEEDEFEMLDS